MSKEPVLILVLVAVLTEAGGALAAFASNMTTVGALIAGATFLTGVGGALTRSLVSPVKTLPPAAGDPVIRERQSF